MRTIVVFALIALVAVSSATKISKAKKGDKTTGSEAHFDAMKNTAFGKNLFNMLSLKFKTSGQVDDIISLLDELNANIAQQQQDDDASFQATSSAYGDTINQQNAIIVDANDNIQGWTQQISDDTDAVNQATAQLDSLQAEADNINNFLAQLAQTRQAEHDAYEQRAADQSAILAGLDEVITLFSAEVENDPNLDADAAEAVLDLLNEIRAAVEESIADDTQAENDAQVTYNNFVNDQNARLADIADEVASLQAQIDGLNAEIDTDNQAIADETVRLNNAVALRDSTQQALDDLTALYTQNTQVRSSQTTLIGQVKARLSENTDDVQSFLNNAI